MQDRSGHADRWAHDRPGRSRRATRRRSVRALDRLPRWTRTRCTARYRLTSASRETQHERPGASLQTAGLDANPGVPPGDVRKALRVLRDSLESFDDGPADRTLERLLGVFAPGAVLGDVVLPYLREVGERWACGEATIAQEHFASNFLEGWMHPMARGWNRSGPRRAVLAYVPGEYPALGLMAFGLALHDLGWRITYLGADAPLPGVEHAAAAVGADVVVLSAALPTTLASQVDALRALSRRHAVAVGGAGAAANRSEWLASRTLPADPIIAAHALTTHQELAPRSTAENRHAPVT